MGTVYDVKEMNRAMKTAHARGWVHRKVGDIRDWFSRNREMILFFGADCRWCHNNAN